MNILFIHQNFPAQYKHLALLMAADPANRVVVLHMRQNLPEIPGITAVHITPDRALTTGLHPWLQEFESKFIRGDATWKAACSLRESGFTPAVVCAHPGWGEALFVKDVWPGARLLSYLEYYYHFRRQDINFDPEFPSRPDDSCRLRIKNINNLLALEACDAGISPTEYQRSLQPAEYQSKISVIHDGIDTDRVRPNRDVTLTMKERGVTLTSRDEVITFVNRNLEPYRGWHTFARALPELLARRPRAHVLIVGGDDVSYGSRPADGVSYKQRYLAEVIDRLDLNRIHFLGKIPYDTLLGLLQISSAHVYLTYPFVLSWSMLEAMSAGALVIGSRTAPVEEVITHGVNGLLVDFFSQEELVATVDELLSHPDRMQAVRDRARQTIVERYDLRRICLPQQQALLHNLVTGKREG